MIHLFDWKIFALGFAAGGVIVPVTAILLLRWALNARAERSHRDPKDKPLRASIMRQIYSRKRA